MQLGHLSHFKRYGRNIHVLTDYQEIVIKYEFLKLKTPPCFFRTPPSDDQSYTDSDKQDDCSSVKSAGQIIVEATTAFIENGMHISVNITIICELSDAVWSLFVHLKPYFQVLHGYGRCLSFRK